MILDNAGEWELNYSEFQNMAEELEFGLRYTSKDRKEESCHAERGIGIKEPKVKAALMQLNLSPQYWQKKSKELNWLMARFPVQSQSAKIPSDGDRMRPLEHATQGYVSRRQIDRELYYFVPIGTPCLVHDEKAKGSQLPHSSGDGCKSQWMIADGMYREQVLFWNPRTNRTIKSKSYTTFALRRGMNFTQLIGVKIPKESELTRPLPSHFTEKITIKLPPMKDDIETERIEHPLGEPIQAVKHLNVDNQSAPIVTQTKMRDGLRGSVHFEEYSGKPMKVNEQNGTIELENDDNSKVNGRHVGGDTEVKLLIAISEADHSCCAEI